MTKIERDTPILEPVNIDDTLAGLFHAGTMSRELMEAWRLAMVAAGQTGKVIPSLLKDDDRIRIEVETKRLANYGMALLGDGNMAAVPVLITSGEWTRRTDHIKAQIEITKNKPSEERRDWEILEKITQEIIKTGGEVILPSENPEHAPILVRFSPAQDFGMNLSNISSHPTVMFTDEPQLTSFATRVHMAHAPLEAVIATLWLDHGELLNYANGITQTSQVSDLS